MAVAVELEGGGCRYFMTWGRIQDEVDTEPLEAIVMAYAANVGLGGQSIRLESVIRCRRHLGSRTSTKPSSSSPASTIPLLVPTTAGGERPIGRCATVAISGTWAPHRRGASAHVPVSVRSQPCAMIKAPRSDTVGAVPSKMDGA